MNINNKVDGNQYSAQEWNEFKNEIQNIITSSGQSLTSNSLQLQQAVARYVANASSYTENGAADAYNLIAIGSNDKISAYIDGAVVTFKAGNSNTGSSTLTIAGLTAKSIKKNGFADVLTAGDIVAGNVYNAFYSLSDDAFEIAEYLSSASSSPDASETVKGILEIATQAETDGGVDDTRAITAFKLANSSFSANIKVAIYADVKSSGSSGGTSSSGFQTRTLNTELSDSDNLGTLSANEVTLIAGTYMVQAYSTAYQANDHAIYLNDGSSRVLSGLTSFNDQGNSDAATVSILNGVVVSTGSETYSIQHHIAFAQSTDGLGRSVSSGTSSIFSMLQFTKIG